MNAFSSADVSVCSLPRGLALSFKAAIRFASGCSFSAFVFSGF